MSLIFSKIDGKKSTLTLGALKLHLLLKQHKFADVRISTK